MIWLAGGAMVVVAAIVAHGPRLKTWQWRIIVLRAAIMTAREMWAQAWLWAHLIWPEMLHRAGRDVGPT